MANNLDLQILENSQALADEALCYILQCAEEAIKKQGRFVFILAGGSTPQNIYRALKNKTTFEHWVLLYGDERFLAEDDSERNAQLFLKATGQEDGSLHHATHIAFPAKTKDATEQSLSDAAMAYQQAIKAYLPADLCLLGMGEDGHTASLFPHNLLSDSKQENLVFAINNSPKAPKERLTLSYQCLAASSELLLLANGEAKSEAIAHILNEQEPRLPVQNLMQIRHASKSTAAFHLWLDKSAAAKL